MQLIAKDIEQIKETALKPLECIPSGFTQLDELVGGLPIGQLVIVGGRASMGKSSMCLDVSLNAAAHGYPVLFLTIEMSGMTVFKRMLSSVALVPAKRFGKTDGDENRRLDDAEHIIREMKIIVDDETEVCPSKILEKIDWFATNCKGPFLTVVDYLDLIQPDERQQSRTYELESIMKKLQKEIKSRNTCLVIACQLNRETEKRENPWPRLADLKSSGAIEQSADMVWLLFREDYYALAEGNIAQELTGEAKIIIAKNRHGPVGCVEVAFIPELASFRNIEGGCLDIWTKSSAPPF